MQLSPEQRLRSRFALADHEMKHNWQEKWLNVCELTDDEAHSYFVDDHFANMTDEELMKELMDRELWCGFCGGPCKLPENPEAHYVSPSTTGY
jgi:hypothetical protein